MARRQAGPIWLLILGTIFATVGYFVAFHFGKPIVNSARQSETWPTVPGVIERSEVATSRSKGKTMYDFDVSYAYTVDGKAYHGSTVWFGGDYRSSSPGVARETVGRYPVGRKVEVHYDPKHPDASVLEPGAFWSTYMVYGIGWIFLAVGGLMLLGSVVRIVALLVIGTVLVSEAVRQGGKNES